MPETFLSKLEKFETWCDKHIDARIDVSPWRLLEKERRFKMVLQLQLKQDEALHKLLKMHGQEPCLSVVDGDILNKCFLAITGKWARGFYTELLIEKAMLPCLLVNRRF